MKLYVGHRRQDIEPARLAEMTAAAVESVRAQLAEEGKEPAELEAVDSYEGMTEGEDLIYLPATLREWAELNYSRWEEIKDRVPDVPSAWEQTVEAKPKVETMAKIALPRYRLAPVAAPWQRAQS